MYEPMKLSLFGLASVSQASLAEYFSIQPMHHHNFCIGVRNASTAEGALVDQFKCHGNTNRLWTLELVDDAHGQTASNHGLAQYRIKNTHSGQCLSVKNVQHNNFAPVWQWDCHGGPNQRFNLLALTTSDGRVGDQIKAVHSGKCLSVRDSSTKNAQPVVQYTCKHAEQGDRDNQIFKIKRAQMGQYSIRNIHIDNSICLTAPGGESVNGLRIHGLECGNDQSQSWKLVDLDRASSPRYYRIINDSTHKCLGVDHSQENDGALITQWDCHGKNNQAFRLKKITTSPNQHSYQLIAKHSGKCVVIGAGNGTAGYSLLQQSCDNNVNQSKHLFTLVETGAGLTFPWEAIATNVKFDIHYRQPTDEHSVEVKCLMGPSIDEINQKRRSIDALFYRLFWAIKSVDNCGKPSSTYGKWVLAAPYVSPHHPAPAADEYRIKYVIGHEELCIQTPDFETSGGFYGSYQVVLSPCVDIAFGEGSDSAGRNYSPWDQNFNLSKQGPPHYAYSIQINHLESKEYLFHPYHPYILYVSGTHPDDINMESYYYLDQETINQRLNQRVNQRSLYFTPYTE